MRGLPSILLITLIASQQACEPAYDWVPISQPELVGAASRLAAHDKTTARDERGGVHDVDRGTELSVARGGTQSAPPGGFLGHNALQTKLGYEIDACADPQHRLCTILDPKNASRIYVQSGVEPDGKKIGHGLIAALALGAVSGLVAGNVACFSQACDDGVKGALVATDVVLAVGVVLVGAAIVYVVGSFALHYH